MTPEERLTRIEELTARNAEAIERHIEFGGTIFTRLELTVENVATTVASLAATVSETSKQVARTAAAQEVTEEHLQKLIQRIDRLEER